MVNKDSYLGIVDPLVSIVLSIMDDDDMDKIDELVDLIANS